MLIALANAKPVRVSASVKVVRVSVKPVRVSARYVLVNVNAREIKGE
jgi:hypothetical protein